MQIFEYFKKVQEYICFKGIHLFFSLDISNKSFYF